jgi:hypothetical protein
VNRTTVGVLRMSRTTLESDAVSGESEAQFTRVRTGSCFAVRAFRIRKVAIRVHRCQESGRVIGDRNRADDYHDLGRRLRRTCSRRDVAGSMPS